MNLNLPRISECSMNSVCKVTCRRRRIYKCMGGVLWELGNLRREK